MALIVGNEATGLNSQLLSIISKSRNFTKNCKIIRIKIPIYNFIESLNCSVAFAIIGFELGKALNK